MRKAKIICTIGPATDAAPVLDQLIEAGMDAARLNFSHGSQESHGRAIARIREVAERRGVSVAIIQDLQGPRIRVGTLREAIDLVRGQTVKLVPERDTISERSAGPSRKDRSKPADHDLEIPVTYQHLAQDVHRGGRILIDDGMVELAVTETGDRGEGGGGGDGMVRCEVITAGRLHSHKGINLPGTRISAPAVSEKDKDDIRFGVAQDVDYIALSFVRGPEDIMMARKLIGECGGDIPVIAKIERPEAVSRLDTLLEHADGIMIARGDLGVEIGPESVPILQKRMIAEANRRRRLVITATQMLESMTHHPRPTRAEASDVANAVFDGTDAVMLSAETAMGQYPVETVRVMDRIIRAAEEGTEPGVIRRSDARRGGVSFPEAICAAASSAAAATGAGAIVTFSESGATARLMSKQRPSAPIIAFTPFEAVRRRMALYWGVIPRTMPMPLIKQTDERIHEAERRLTGEGLVSAGDRMVIVSGGIIGQRGGTNLMKLHEVP
jgi:pyruvate kinase